jgi:hypothetical protein
MAPGNSTEYEAGPKREPLWYVEWHKGATVDVTGKGEVSHGMMEGVSGFVYEQVKPAKSVKGSTFESKKGQGDQTRKILSLIGEVHVHSITRSADLYCDRLVYDAKAKQIRADGHVRVVSHVGTIGPVPQLWATPDLKMVATPRMFSSP